MGGLKINKISKALGAFTGSSTDPLLTSNAASGQVNTAANTFGALADGNIWIGNASNVPVPHLISGDITISNTGVAAIGAGVIVNGDIAPAAGITLTKLAPVGFSLALVSDGGGFITTSLTTATQVGYLSTTTSDIQVQLNAKQGVITGAASTVVTANLNPNIVAVTDGAGKFISSTTPVAKLTFINNLTSDAQAQINTKLAVTLGVTAVGDLLYFNGGGWTNFPRGTAGQILTSTGATIAWGAATANGLPVGGTAAQFLAKNSGVNFDAGWFTLTTSLITDITATAAQINASTTYLTLAGSPTGTNGQALIISGGVMGWSNVGTGTVTSVNVSGGTTGLTFAGGPITVAGTITMSGTLGTVNGGTNQTAVAVGDLLYGSGVNTWSRLTATTNGFVLTLSAGIPTWVAPGAGTFWIVNGATTITANTSQTGAFTNTFLLNSVVVTQNNQSGGAIPAAFRVNGGTHSASAAATALLVNAPTGSTNNYAATFSGGNVGIGTTTPTQSLDIVGNIKASALSGAGTRMVTADATGLLGTQALPAPAGSTNQIQYNNAGAFAANANFVWDIANSRLGVNIAAPAHRLSLSGGHINFANTAQADAYVIANTSAASFSYGIDNAGNGTSGGQWAVYSNDDAAYRLTVQRGTGRVGIGTAAPLQRLTVNGIISTLDQTGYFLLGQVPSTDAYIASDASKHLYFGTANVARVALLTSGNFGIGLTGPTTTLHVQSTAITVATFDSTSSTTQIILNATGTNRAGLQFDSAGNRVLLFAATVPLTLFAGGAEIMRLNTNGTVLFDLYTGSGTTTATLSSTGLLGRTTAVSFDGASNIIIEDGKSIFTGLVTGTMFGTSDLQKLAFYGQIPDRQPDTGITSIAKLTFGGSPIGENDTIGGYTIGQVVAALKQLGLLQ